LLAVLSPIWFTGFSAATVDLVVDGESHVDMVNSLAILPADSTVLNDFSEINQHQIIVSLIPQMMWSWLSTMSRMMQQMSTSY